MNLTTYFIGRFSTMIQRSRLLLPLLTIMLAALTGCASKSGTMVTHYLDSSMYKSAWQTLKSEGFGSSSNCEERKIYFDMLTRIVNYDFAPPDADRLVAETNIFLKNKCSGEYPAYSDYLTGKYFLQTNRPGTAFAPLENAVKSSENITVLILAESAQAQYFSRMGNFGLQQLLFERCLSKAREFVKVNPDAPAAFWAAYAEVLEVKLRLMSERGSAADKPDMKDGWRELEEVSAHLPRTTVWTVYQNGAIFFSRIDNFFAWNLLRKAEEYGNRYISYNDSGNVKLSLRETEIHLLIADGRFAEASALVDNYLAAKQYIVDEMIGPADLKLAGIVNEKKGDYGKALKFLIKAIELEESARDSFQVSQRGNYLNQVSVKPYLAMLSSYVNLYLKDPSSDKLARVVDAEMLLRARQFSDLLKIGNKRSNILQSLVSSLKDNEIVLDYVVGDDYLVLLALSRDFQQVYTIPITKGKLDKQLQNIRNTIAGRGEFASYKGDLNDVSEVLLGRLEQVIGKYDKLTVISDGNINYIPFGILLYKNQPLIDKFAVSSVPSLSFFINARLNTRHSTENAFFALADPQYNTDLLQQVSSDALVNDFFTRSVRDSNVFVQLPETKAEVEAISGFFPKGNSTILAGSAASKERVMSLDLSRYRYLHFATHGILGDVLPGISEPALVVSGKKGDLDSGFLKMNEIEKLGLRSDLTVLSACDTGNGKNVTGEGIMGLSRAFLVAGSRSVLVTLWPIDSNATVEFMIRFYSYLTSGKSKAEALKLTQMSFVNNNRTGNGYERGFRIVAKNKPPNNSSYSHPYFWAPFVLVGE